MQPKDRPKPPPKIVDPRTLAPNRPPWHWRVRHPRWYARAYTWWNNPNFSWTPKGSGSYRPRGRALWAESWRAQGWRRKKTGLDWCSQVLAVAFWLFVTHDAFNAQGWGFVVLMGLPTLALIVWTEVQARWENRVAVAKIQAALVAIWAVLAARHHQEQQQRQAEADRQRQQQDMTAAFKQALREHETRRGPQ